MSRRRRRGAPLWLTCEQRLDAQIERQVEHWVLAAARLDLDDLASPEAWSRLERYLGLSLRKHLTGVIDRLAPRGRVLTRVAPRGAKPDRAAPSVRRRLLAFRRRYLRAETTLDFFADAINTRTSPHMVAPAARLRHARAPQHGAAARSARQDHAGGR